MFWSSFFRGFIFGQNAKWGGGGKAIAKRFGALLKIFFKLDSLQGVFDLGKMSKGGVLGVPKSLEHFFFRISTPLGFPKVLEYGKKLKCLHNF